jgi:hypothetical protein
MDDDSGEDNSWIPQVPGYTNYPSGKSGASAAQLEADMHPGETSLQRAKRMFSEAADLAAGSIIDIALHDPNSRLRLDAAKYITDRVMGPTSQVNPVDAEDNPLDKLMRSYTENVESFANGGQVSE